MMDESKLKICDVPTIISGSASAILEPNGRLAIPSPWRGLFRDSNAYVLSLCIGEIPCKNIFPEENFRWVLDQVDDCMKGPLVRAADQHHVDNQSRIVLSRELFSVGATVSLLGAGAYFQVVPEPMGEFITYSDAESISGLFGA